jgi:hypothetical protein
MMTTAHDLRPAMPDGIQAQFETLESLPCGCVVAIHRVVASSRVRVISLEAKGPHCTYGEHRVNRAVRLGDLFDAADYDEGDGIPI